MADIKGDAITIAASERINKAIEQVGATSSIDHIGKGLEITNSGVKMSNASTKPSKFVGVVKAVGADAEPEFQVTRVIDGNVKFGDLITTDADGKFVTTTTYADAVGRAHSDSDSNDVAYVYVRAM